MTAGDLGVTAAGSAIGTVGQYMSPEQVRGEEPSTPAPTCSRWALVLYEMVATGPRGVRRRDLRRHRGRHPQSSAGPSAAPSVNPSLPPELERIIAKALEK